MTKAQVEFIQSLERDGEITPDELVEAAHPEESPIHDMFTWDDSEAARKHRVNEARSALARVRVSITYEQYEVKVPTYVRDVRVPAREQGYVRGVTLRTHEDAVQDLLEREFQQIAARVRRGRALAVQYGQAEAFEARLAGLLSTVPIAAAG